MAYGKLYWVFVCLFCCPKSRHALGIVEKLSMSTGAPR
jgi:hypothetical protein